MSYESFTKIYGMVPELGNTIESIKLQSGNPVLPFEHAVEIQNVRNTAHTDSLFAAHWGQLSRNSFTPGVQSDRPFGILINLMPDIDQIPYITPRWLKLAIRPEYEKTLADSVPAQQIFLEAAGFTPEEAQNMFYLTRVNIEGREYAGTVSTHLGRSVEAIVKHAASAEPEVVSTFASAVYQKAAAQVLEVYQTPITTINGTRHYYQADPNPGNVLVMATDGGEIRVINYDLTNKGKISTKAVDSSVAAQMFFNFAKGARIKGIPFPNTIEELLYDREGTEIVLRDPQITYIARAGF